MKPHRTVSHWFYIGVVLLMILLNIAAFGPSLVNQSGRNTPLPLTPLVMAHAAMSVAWLLLFLTQVTLVATRRTAVHRRLGIVGAVLIVGFTVTGIYTVIAEARRGFDLSGDLSHLPLQPGADAQAAFTGQLFFFATFAVLAGAAEWFRRRPAVHKRLMLLAVLGGLTATPVAHIIGHWSVLQPWTPLIFPISLLCFLSMIAIGDRVIEGRIHPVSVWGAGVVFLSNLVFNLAIVPSSAWHSFAAWLTR